MKKASKVTLVGVLWICWLAGCSEEEVFRPTRLGVGDGFLIDRAEISYYPRYSVILPVPKYAESLSYMSSYSLVDIPKAAYDIRVVAVPRHSDSEPAHWGDTVRAAEKSETKISIRISSDPAKSTELIFEDSSYLADWKTAGSGVHDWYFYKLTELDLEGKSQVEVSFQTSERLEWTLSFQVELTGGGKRK